MRTGVLMGITTSIYWGVILVRIFCSCSFFVFYFLNVFTYIETNRIAAQVDNLWGLDDAGRAAFIRTKLKRQKKEAQAQFQILIQQYQKICDESEDTNNSLKVEILKRAKVIGFTISGTIL